MLAEDLENSDCLFVRSNDKHDICKPIWSAVLFTICGVEYDTE